MMLLTDEEPFSKVLIEFLNERGVIRAVEKQTGTKYVPGVYQLAVLFFFSVLFGYILVLVAHNKFKFHFPGLLTKISRARGDNSVLEHRQTHFSDSLHHITQVSYIEVATQMYHA